ncbi:LysR substrate-binding domain-containing protein [Candidatus Rariloculus sp.]|uniref:LysR substrate-binding domain-containing protein n=1 Tax=Candidatus Rariloculus sp. TaxID=3101265 RepID=UPI003D0FBD36
MSLTAAGRHFRDAVVAGLGVISAGATEATYLSNGDQVVIACGHDISHLVVFQRYDVLRATLGKDTRVRLLTYQRNPRAMPIDPIADIVLAWNTTNVAAEDMALVFKEEVQLVCSPGYAATHADTLSKPISDWGGLTFLDVDSPNLGWATWSDWFETAGYPVPRPRFEGFDSYVQVLEAACAGLGIALGWRNCIERYLDSGAIEMLAEGFVEFDNSFVAALTAKGRRNASARKCLAFFEHWPLRGTTPTQ